MFAADSASSFNPRGDDANSLKIAGFQSESARSLHGGRPTQDNDVSTSPSLKATDYACFSRGQRDSDHGESASSPPGLAAGGPQGKHLRASEDGSRKINESGRTSPNREPSTGKDLGAS